MQQLKSFDEHGLQFAWDQTSLGYASECLRKYQYFMLEGWRPRSASVHLIFGGVYASALEHYHKFRADGVDHNGALANVVHQALIATWDEEHNRPMEFLHASKTRENLIRSIVWYFEHFEHDSCKTVILSNGAAAVEHSFALPVDNGIVLTGHLDRLVDYEGKIYIQDQKTTGTTITPRFFDGYAMDNQMFQYTFAGKMIFNLPVKGVIIDGAQIAVGFTRFERGFVFCPDAQLNEWYDNSMWWIELARKATAENHFPMNRKSCGNYGGCQFRSVCSKSPAVRKNFLSGDFEQGKRWDPLESR